MAIPFQRHILTNGLHQIVHEDPTTPLAACNLIYKVGSRDEHPDHTGMAHLFEHYMFCGSKNIPDYDVPLQKIGAVNNAYTSQDHTHYYIVLPANNLETALWLESDRMLSLAFEQQGLDTQKQVVIEEFKEVCLNRPFGDLWSMFNDFVFEKYPYKWFPIGKKISHIEEVTMDMMKKFFFHFYRPDNAVLVIGGNVHFDEVVELVEKWFGDIPAGDGVVKNFPEEPVRTKAKFLEVQREAPYDMLLKGWVMPDRLHPDFYAYDMLSDLFSSGQSSYLYKKFVTDNHLFTDLSMTVSGAAGPNLFALVARPAEDVSMEDANARLNQFLYHDFCYDDSLTIDLQKVKNKNESALLENEIKLESRTSILAVSESVSRIEDFENDEQKYRAITETQIRRITADLFQPQKECTLFYKSSR